MERNTGESDRGHRRKRSEQRKRAIGTESKVIIAGLPKRIEKKEQLVYSSYMGEGEQAFHIEGWYRRHHHKRFSISTTYMHSFSSIGAGRGLLGIWEVQHHRDGQFCYSPALLMHDHRESWRLLWGSLVDDVVAAELWRASYRWSGMVINHRSLTQSSRVAAPARQWAVYFVGRVP